MYALISYGVGAHDDAETLADKLTWGALLIRCDGRGFPRGPLLGSRGAVCGLDAGG
jgi:hypothetical protein